MQWMFLFKIYVRKHPLVPVPEFSSWNSHSLLNDHQALLEISASLCCYSQYLDRLIRVSPDSFALLSGQAKPSLHILKQTMFILRQPSNTPEKLDILGNQQPLKSLQQKPLPPLPSQDKSHNTPRSFAAFECIIISSNRVFPYNIN